MARGLTVARWSGRGPAAGPGKPETRRPDPTTGKRCVRALGFRRWNRRPDPGGATGTSRHAAEPIEVRGINPEPGAALQRGGVHLREETGVGFYHRLQFRTSGEVVPLVRIATMVVEFLGAIRVANVTEIPGAHRVVVDEERGDDRVPWHLRVQQLRAKRAALQPWFRGEPAEFDQGRVNVH